MLVLQLPEPRAVAAAEPFRGQRRVRPDQLGEGPAHHPVRVEGIVLTLAR